MLGSPSLKGPRTLHREMQPPSRWPGVRPPGGGMTRALVRQPPAGRSGSTPEGAVGLGAGRTRTTVVDRQLSRQEGRSLLRQASEEQIVGYRQREKKRRKAGAVAAAQRQSRRTGSSAGKWWLTVVSKNTCCARCDGALREDRPMIYRREPGESLCLPCAERDPAVKARPSVRWEQMRRRVGARR
jgi:hypothetical protein